MKRTTKRARTTKPEPVRLATTPPPIAWTLEQLAESYHVSVRTLLRQVASGELVATRPGRSYLVTEPNVRTWLERRAVKPAGKRARGR